MRMLSLAQSAPARPTITRLLYALPRLFALRRERRALLRLDDHMLCDVGLTRDAALSEAARKVWDAPLAWRR